MNRRDYENLDRWIINGSTWDDTFRRPDPEDEEYAYLDEDSYEDYIEGLRTEYDEKYNN